MGGSRRRRRQGLLTAAAALLLPGLCGLSGSPAVAGVSPRPAAPTPTPPGSSPDRLAVTVAEVTPTALTASSPLVLSGTVRNTGSTAVGAVQVQLAAGPVLGSRQQLAAQRANAADPERLVRGPVRLSAQRELAPGAASSFTVGVPAGPALGLPADARVIAVQVQAVGTVEGMTAILGRATLDLPSFPAEITSPVEVGLVVPVTAPPDWLPGADGVVPAPTDAFVADLSPAGRLGRLLSVGEVGGQAGGPAPQVTLAVDPALVRRVSALAPPGADAPPSIRPAAHAAAQAWLQRLRAVAGAPGVTVMALPPGDADLAALASAGPAAHEEGVRLLRAAPEQLRALLGQTTASPDLAVLPADGVLPLPAVDLALQVGAVAALVSDTQLPAPVGVPGAAAPEAPPAVKPATPTSVSTLPGSQSVLPALVTDNRLQDLLTTADTSGPPGPATGTRLAELDLLAELAVITSEAPNLQARRGFILLAPRRWDASVDYLRRLVRDLAAVPWVESAALSRLTRSAAPGRNDDVRVPASVAAPATLPPAALADIAALRGPVAALADLPPPGVTEQHSPPLAEALDRASSAWWRADPAAGQALRDQVRALVHAELDKVVLGANSAGVRLTGASGSVPVQLSNGLDEPVAVQLKLRDAGGRDAVLPVTKQLVLARPQRGQPPLVRQEQITVTARARGRTRTELQLFTKSGLPVLTAPKPLDIVSSAYGPLAVGITASALTVLVLAFVVRGVRWIRRRRVRSPAAAPGPA